jgi:hypothetical protein
MNITVNIVAETPEEVMTAITKLATFGKTSEQVKKPSTRGNKAVEPEKPVEPEQPVKEEIPNKSQTEDPISAAVPTVVELRAAAQEKGKTPEGKKQIKNLLNSFDSKSISAVPEDKRVAFLAALEEL